MAIQVGIGISTEKDPDLAAKKAIRQAKINLQSNEVSLAIVFSSISLACGSLLKTISDLLYNVPLLGGSGAAIITNQGIFNHGLGIMLLSLPESISIDTALVRQIDTKSGIKAGEELGEKLLRKFGDARRSLSVIFSDGLIKEVSGFLSGVQERLGRSFPLAGASCSDNLRFSKTYVYFNRDLFSDAACGVLWGGKLNFGLGVKHGWRPLGKPRYVTKSSGNVVYEIDGTLAAKIYEEYFACDLIELKKKLKYISILYPIGIYLIEEEEYLLRNLLSIENNGSLIFQGDVPERSQIRLMIGTKESCLEATQDAVNEAKKNFSGAMGSIGKKEKVNFVLVFDSVSRYILLRKDAHRESGIIKNGFSQDTPMLGIYTYGEQAPLRATAYQGKAYFHNQTVTILAMGGTD